MPPIIYHERQVAQMCGLHALNNLYQRREHMFTKEQLDAYCYALTPRAWLNPHRSWLGLGDYDVNVMMYAVQQRNGQAIWYDRRRDPICLNLGAIFGFILNVCCTWSYINGFFGVPNDTTTDKDKDKKEIAKVTEMGDDKDKNFPLGIASKLSMGNDNDNDNDILATGANSLVPLANNKINIQTGKNNIIIPTGYNSNNNNNNNNNTTTIVCKSNTNNNSEGDIPDNGKPPYIPSSAAGRHWVALRLIDGNYYNLDSMLNKPQTIGNEAQFLHFIRFRLLHETNNAMFLVVDSDVAERRLWLKPQYRFLPP